MKTAFVAAAVTAAACGAVLLSAQSAPPSGPARLRGFSEAASAAALAREREFQAMPDAKVAEADFDVMTAEPHHTGSPYEIKLADYVADKFKSFGLDVSRDEYGVLLPWPGERRLDIVGPENVKLQVEEETIRGDQWADKPGILPAYNAYSPSGDVTGDIVYVNFGVPGDYETLEKLGIDVKGKIVLARYGGSWRGIKPKVAAEHGAIACLIYSDPHEDGYVQGDVYPDGPFRAWGMIQRGSDGHAAVSGRSVDAGSAVETRCRADPDRSDQNVLTDSGTTALVPRRRGNPQASRRAGRAGSVARRAADHLSHRSRPGQDSHAGAHGLRAPAVDQRHRPHHRP